MTCGDADAKIMDRLLAQSLETHHFPPVQVGGEDLCSGCDEEMCNQMESCGYVQVRFGTILWIHSDGNLFYGHRFTLETGTWEDMWPRFV